VGAKLWVRLNEKDWEGYGSDWYSLDLEQLLDSSAKKLAALERLMGGYSIAKMVEEMTKEGAMARRAVAYLARRESGVLQMWDDFDPRPWGMEFTEQDPAGGDADPPDSGGPPQTTSDSSQGEVSPSSSATSDPG
jgi:hypothetical protein